MYKNKLLNLELENMRPQKMIENTDNIPDKTYQMNEPDNKKSDKRDQISKSLRNKLLKMKKLYN